MEACARSPIFFPKVPNENPADVRNPTTALPRAIPPFWTRPIAPVPRRLRAPVLLLRSLLACEMRTVGMAPHRVRTHLHVDHYHNQLKYGLPEFLFNYTVDIHHTLTYATGYLIKQVNPRCGMVTHLAFDNDTLNETSADVRAHWDGLFLYGAPDVVVVNVTKDAIWHREAALPGFAGQSLPKPNLLFGDPLPIATGKGLWQPCTFSPAGEALWMAGRYFEEYRREDGLWRFEHVQIELRMLSPYDAGWARRRMMELP